MSFNSELANSDNILVAKVLNQKENQFSVKVIKVWKSYFNVGDSIDLIQITNDCNNFLLKMNEYYVLFFNKNHVSQCSRSSNYRNSKYIPALDSIYQDEIRLLDSYNKTLVDSLEYNRKYVFETNSKLVCRENNKILYIYKNKVIKEKDIPTSEDSFYPVKLYYITDSLRVENNFFDHVIFISTDHQDMIWSDKRN